MISRLAAILIFILTLPLVATCAILIVIIDRAPPIYPAKRLGLNGQMFDMYKFRSMRLTTEDLHLTMKNDERISRLGRFLRATNIDEIPQLINIISDEMRFIGPRPEDPGLLSQLPPHLMEQYLSFQPGLTSLGSLYAKIASKDLVHQESAENHYVTAILPKRAELDYAYMSNRSFSKDVRLIWTTIQISFGKKIAYEDLDKFL
jgi:lipopolysaccharide/colanic/teichoic acid biosynthesis glycosyltransferase